MPAERHDGYDVEAGSEYGHYAHSRMLHSYGTTAGNPAGHLRAMLTGNHVVFPVSERKIVRGCPGNLFL